MNLSAIVPWPSHRSESFTMHSFRCTSPQLTKHETFIPPKCRGAQQALPQEPMSGLSQSATWEGAKSKGFAWNIWSHKHQNSPRCQNPFQTTWLALTKLLPNIETYTALVANVWGQGYNPPNSQVQSSMNQRKIRKNLSVAYSHPSHAEWLPQACCHKCWAQAKSLAWKGRAHFHSAAPSGQVTINYSLNTIDMKHLLLILSDTNKHTEQKLDVWHIHKHHLSSIPPAA